MIQLRTVLTSNSTSQIVQEPDGTLSHDALFADKPWSTTPLQERDAGDIRALLYHEKATDVERAKCIPVAKDLAAGKTPAPADVQAVRDAKAAADTRAVELIAGEDLII